MRYESEAIAAYAMKKLNELEIPTGDKIEVDVFTNSACMLASSDMSSMLASRQALSDDLVRNLILLNSIDSSLASSGATAAAVAAAAAAAAAAATSSKPLSSILANGTKKSQSESPNTFAYKISPASTIAMLLNQIAAQVIHRKLTTDHQN